jgi:hypothetical protein
MTKLEGSKRQKITITFLTDKFGFESRQLYRTKVSPALVLRCLFPPVGATHASPLRLFFAD